MAVHAERHRQPGQQGQPIPDCRLENQIDANVVVTGPNGSSTRGSRRRRLHGALRQERREA
jgi:hypothetical protein